MRGILQDNLTQLRNGDVATDIMTGLKIINYYGVIGYAIPVEWGGSKCSTLRINVQRTVTELVGVNYLPGNWVLHDRHVTTMPQHLLFTY